MTSPIDHIFVLMLENRSFDHLLAYSGIPGLIGIDTTKTNPGTDETPVGMSSDTLDRASSDPGHEFENVDWQIYGAPPGGGARPIQMNGFADKGWLEAMQCAKPGLVPVLTSLARQFLVCDNWFSSMPGPTWPNRFFVHAGSSGGLANSPSGLTVAGSMLWSELGFSFEHGSLFEALANAGRTWRVYHGDHFPQVCAIDTMPSIFVASADRFRKMKQFSADVSHGDAADYTFIEPDYSILSSFRNGNSQHPSGTLSAGEQLIETTANALIGSPLWSNSLLIVLYDEHGGFYDQVPTPTGVTPPGDEPLNASKAQYPPSPAFAFDRLGVRVPAVIVSPYVKPATVCHTVFDHASVIRTVFDIFGLPRQLTDRDGKAQSLAPLLESSVQVATAVLPAAPTASQMSSNVPPRFVHSLNGFARIAAQVHHALSLYQPGMLAEMLKAAISAQPDVSTLPAYPKSADPDTLRTYIAHVATLVEAHRMQQRAAATGNP